MKTFGKLERDDASTRLPALTPGALTPGRKEPPVEQPAASQRERVVERPVMSASLRERVIEQIEPSVAATVPREVLRRQIEEIIHQIANEERLELSGREHTVIVPAQREGFEKAFIGANAWWAIRIAEKHRANLKWIAAYQVLPVAAVTHIAEIDHLEPYGDAGKFKVVFKGPATPLAHPVPYGDAPSGAMQGPRYTTKAALLA